MKHNNAVTSKEDLHLLLSSLNFYNYFDNNFLNRTYTIDYGKRKGKHKFESFLEAVNVYSLNNFYPIEQARIDNWKKILSEPLKFSPDQLLIEILDILDWGQVWNGNIKEVIYKYRNNCLSEYIEYINQFIIKPKLIEKPHNNIQVKMTSGWTKIYSYTYDNLLIYDSRVSAFLNFILISSFKNHIDSGNIIIKNNFNKIISMLYNFGGGTGENNRFRKIPNIKGFRKNNQPEDNINGFNANIFATWIAELLIENSSLKDEKISIRKIERGFFMLGFDLNQIK